MNKRILAHLALFGLLAGMGNPEHRVNSERKIGKGLYEPEKKIEFDKKGNPIKRTAKGKRKSKKGKRQ